MPDLDLIKQVEQGYGTGVGGSPGAGRAIPPAGRAAAATMSTALPGCCLPTPGSPLSRGHEFGRPRDLLTASFAGVTNNRSIVIHAI
jgi:hypothetical protein